MATSNAPFPRILTAIDDLTRPDHFYLRVEDQCHFFGEYVSRHGYQYSPTNNLILNFKKPLDRRPLPEWHYKENAILQVASAFRNALLPHALDRLTFVPIPPSKAKDHPLYDDRLTRMLHQIRPDPPLDVRELIIQTTSTIAAHDAEERPTPAEIQAGYSLDPDLLDPKPALLLVIDDLLTTGAHFRAAEQILRAAFPDTPIIGAFVARRTFPDESLIPPLEP